MSLILPKRMQHFSPFYVMELLEKAQQLEASGRDIIHMEVGEPDFSTPERVVKVAQDQLLIGNVKYTAAAGLPQLRNEIAKFYQKNHQLEINPERIFVTPGASGAFILALAATINPQDKIMMADPCYPCNANFVHFFGATPQTVKVTAETAFQLSSRLIADNADQSLKGVIVASPSNPTGTVVESSELAAMINQVNAMDCHFFSDEIYHGLVYAEKAETALKFSDNVFVINSFSKYFLMTGWRIGWLVVPEEYIGAVEKLAQNLFISTATLSQYAALEALSDKTRVELEQIVQKFRQRRDFLYHQLLALGFKVPLFPKGAFYIYADCSAFSNDSYAFAYRLLENTGVAMTPGKDFGNNEPNRYIRFAYTSSIAKMSAAIERLEKYLCP